MKQPKTVNPNDWFTKFGYIGDGKQRNARQGLPPHPTDYPAWDKADAYAMRSLSLGQAEPHQQQRIFKWMIMVSRVDAMSYQRESDRDTSFAEGMRFMGHLMRFLARANLESRNEK